MICWYEISPQRTFFAWIVVLNCLEIIGFDIFFPLEPRKLNQVWEESCETDFKSLSIRYYTIVFSCGCSMMLFVSLERNFSQVFKRCKLELCEIKRRREFDRYRGISAVMRMGLEAFSRGGRGSNAVFSTLNHVNSCLNNSIHTTCVATEYTDSLTCSVVW